METRVSLPTSVSFGELLHLSQFHYTSDLHQTLFARTSKAMLQFFYSQKMSCYSLIRRNTPKFNAQHFARPIRTQSFLRDHQKNASPRRENPQVRRFNFLRRRTPAREYYMIPAVGSPERP